MIRPILLLANAFFGACIGYALHAVQDSREQDFRLYDCSAPASLYFGNAFGDDADLLKDKRLHYQISVAGRMNEITEPDGQNGWRCQRIY